MFWKRKQPTSGVAIEIQLPKKQYSELEKMIIRTKQPEFEEAVAKAMVALTNMLDEWTPEDRRGWVAERLVRSIQSSVLYFMLNDDERGGGTPIVIEHVIGDFGSKVLASLKKTARRK